MAEGRERHKKMAGIFAMLIFILVGIGACLTVVFYFKHLWSILFVLVFLFLGFMTPNICFGYDTTQDMDHNRGTLDVTTYKNCRDLSYVLAGVFALLTYIVPTIAWLVSDGTSPTITGTCVIFVGNTSFIWAFIIWLRIFMITSTNE